MDNSNDFIKKAKDPKTSSSNGESSEEKTSGESTVQEGQQVVNEEDQNKAINTEQTNEEYISDINNNTIEANKNPTGLTGLAMPGGNDDEDDEDDEDDDDDDPLKEIEIGDDPEETKKKIPVM
jgi:hypothetical protein